jgi:hypothetical protein
MIATRKMSPPCAFSPDIINIYGRQEVLTSFCFKGDPFRTETGIGFS